MNNAQTVVRQKRFRLIWLVPIAIFLILGVFLGIGLTRDPRYVPSPLIDKPVPVFDLPAVQGRELGLSSDNLSGEVSLVNVFASWCVACRQEHPLLMELSRTGSIPIHGLNYKDEQSDAAAWLDQFGDPYTRTGADIDGRVGIDWGVYGVPETFIIGADGRIAYKHVGPIDEQEWKDKMLPIIMRLRGVAHTQ